MITVGSRWVEKESGRTIVVLAVEVHGTDPAWHYEDEPPTAWHYCDVADFVLWGRFERAPGTN